LGAALFSQSGFLPEELKARRERCIQRLFVVAFKDGSGEVDDSQSITFDEMKGASAFCFPAEFGGHGRDAAQVIHNNVFHDAMLKMGRILRFPKKVYQQQLKAEMRDGVPWWSLQPSGAAFAESWGRCPQKRGLLGVKFAPDAETLAHRCIRQHGGFFRRV